MAVSDKLKDTAWTLDYHAKALAKAAADLPALVAAVRAAEESASEDAFSRVDWSQKIPAMTPRSAVPCDLSRVPGYNTRPEDGAVRIAAMTDEQVAEFDAVLAPALALQAEVDKHNAAVQDRWYKLLSAHGVGMHKRTDVRGLALAQATTAKELPYGQVSVSRAFGVLVYAAGDWKNADGRTIAGLRAAARRYVAAAQEKAASARAEAERLARAEREARELRTQLARAQAAPVAPPKPPQNPKALEPQRDESAARVRALEME